MDRCEGSLRIAVVERGLVGWSCPNIACLPTKNVVHSAKVADFVRHDRDFASGTAQAFTQMPEVRGRKRAMVSGLVSVNRENAPDYAAALANSSRGPAQL